MGKDFLERTAQQSLTGTGDAPVLNRSQGLRIAPRSNMNSEHAYVHYVHCGDLVEPL